MKELETDNPASGDLGQTPQDAAAAQQRRIEELELRLQSKEQELEQMRREFESFKQAINHDLRAPLRAIQGFSQALLEDYGEQLDSRGQDYLHRVVNSMHHAFSLMDQLVHLSRVGYVPLRPEWIDMTSLANGVAQETGARFSEVKPKIVVQPSLRAYGDRTLLRVLLEKLFENGYKAVRHQPEPRIELLMIRDDGNETAFALQDNGLGFDPAYAGKLFQPFQRLHPAKDFGTGTGMGLTIAKKVMERHQGRIWAEGTIRGGARFCFSLPHPPTRDE